MKLTTDSHDLFISKSTNDSLKKEANVSNELSLDLEAALDALSTTVKKEKEVLHMDINNCSFIVSCFYFIVFVQVRRNTIIRMAFISIYESCCRYCYYRVFHIFWEIKRTRISIKYKQKANFLRDLFSEGGDAESG